MNLFVPVCSFLLGLAAGGFVLFVVSLVAYFIFKLVVNAIDDFLIRDPDAE